MLSAANLCRPSVRSVALVSGIACLIFGRVPFDKQITKAWH